LSYFRYASSANSTTREKGKREIIVQLFVSIQLQCRSAGDETASLSKYFVGKIDLIWANFIRFGRIWLNLEKI